MEESIRESDSEKKQRAREAADRRFDACWAAYRHPPGDPLPEGRAAWDEAVGQGTDPDALANAASAYAESFARNPNPLPLQFRNWIARGHFRNWPPFDRPGPKVSAQTAAPAPVEDEARVALGVPPELAERWRSARLRLRARLGDAAWRSWIMPLELRAGDATRALLAAPTRFIRDHVRGHHEAAIAAALGGLSIDFVVNTGGHHAGRNGTGNDHASS